MADKRHKNSYNLTREELLHHCISIAEDYGRQSLRLTVRQLYYQLVARGLEANGQHHYKRIVTVLSEARLAGQFPMHLIEDRGRDVGMSKTTVQLDVSSADAHASNEVSEAPERLLWTGRWVGQPILPFVWVEKEALAGVFERPCSNLGVGLFPCKGYPSLQALWHWIEQVQSAFAETSDYEHRQALAYVGNEKPWERVVVLYFGDHDPDGLEIPRSALRNIEQLVDAHGVDGFPDVEFKRCALTKEQIARYNPPPFPAKESSSRYPQYVRETGLKDAWELDALEPRVLRDLINREVNALFDPEIHSNLSGLVETRRDSLRSIIAAPGWIDDALGRERGYDGSDDDDFGDDD